MYPTLAHTNSTGPTGRVTQTCHGFRCHLLHSGNAGCRGRPGAWEHERLQLYMPCKHSQTILSLAFVAALLDCGPLCGAGHGCLFLVLLVLRHIIRTERNHNAAKPCQKESAIYALGFQTPLHHSVQLAARSVARNVGMCAI